MPALSATAVITRMVIAAAAGQGGVGGQLAPVVGLGLLILAATITRDQ